MEKKRVSLRGVCVLTSIFLFLSFSHFVMDKFNFIGNKTSFGITQGESC